VGVAISLAVYPFTWLWYLIGMMLKKPPLPSIADWISSTRQYETGKPVLQFRSAMLQAFLPFAIAVFLQVGLFIPVYNWFVSSYTQESKRTVKKEVPLTPEMKAQMEQRAKERDEMIERMVKQREANAGKNTIKAISRLEQRHLEEQGDFTEDLEGLIKRYATGPNKNLTALLGPVMEDEIRVKKTAAGIEIWVVDPSSGDWMHEELRRGK
jgi:hypothetical protein